MDQTITGLSKTNFHGVVNIVWQIMNAGDSSVVRTRATAEEYVKDNSLRFRVLESGGEVLGMYSYKTGDVNTISFFGLLPLARSSRRGYALYRDMYTHLSGKPTFIIVYDNNKDMKKVVSKRAEHIGNYLSKDGEILNYYMLNFKNEDWK